MKKQLRRANLFISKSTIHGYGVFANEDIRKGGIIEECHVLTIPNKIPELMDHIFYGRPLPGHILPFGYGCIYNHADHPNAWCGFNSGMNVLVFRACRLIKKGEEININYGKNWFASRSIEVEHFFQKDSLQKRISHFFFLGRFLLVVLAVCGIIFSVKLMY